VTPAGVDRQLGRVVVRLLAFTLTVVLLAGAASAAIAPWIELTWWRVFRRCVSVSALATLLIFLRTIHHQGVAWIGLSDWRPGRRRLLQGLGLSLTAAALLGSLYLATGVWRIQIHPDQARVWRVLLLAAPSMLLVGVLEEAIFRGYLLRQLLVGGRALAVLVTSLAYALVHVRSAWEWPQTFLELIGLSLLGCLLAMTALRTGDLYLAIGLHAGLAYAARVNKLLVQLSDPSLVWVAGTSRLVNGLGAWVAFAGLAWLIARWWGGPRDQEASA
jgi:membrane protease YdiL (CAAX protease family)